MMIQVKSHSGITKIFFSQTRKRVVYYFINRRKELQTGHGYIITVEKYNCYKFDMFIVKSFRHYQNLACLLLRKRKKVTLMQWSTMN
jgi:hypothetical protein